MKFVESYVVSCLKNLCRMKFCGLLKLDVRKHALRRILNNFLKFDSSSIPLACAIIETRDFKNSKQFYQQITRITNNKMSMNKLTTMTHKNHKNKLIRNYIHLGDSN